MVNDEVFASGNVKVTVDPYVTIEVSGATSRSEIGVVTICDAEVVRPHADVPSVAPDADTFEACAKDTRTIVRLALHSVVGLAASTALWNIAPDNPH